MSAPTISLITPMRGYYYGGNTVIITGTGFDTNTKVFFGETELREYRIDDATRITAISPTGISGNTCNIIITNTDGTETYSRNFVFYAPVIYKPDNNFKTYLNGKDVSDYVLKQPIIKTELNILVKWDVAFDEISLSLPEEADKILFNNSNDRVIMKDKNDNIVFLGYIKNKDRDRSARKILITSCPLLSLISKKSGPFISTTAKNAMLVLYDLLSTAAPTGFYVNKKIKSLAAALPGIGLYLNSADDLNYMSAALSLCETIGIGLFLEGNIINAKIVGKFPATAKQMTLLTRPTYQERQYLNYNKIILKYKTGPSASEATVTATALNIIDPLEYVITPSNMYFTAIAAQALANHLLAIYTPLYSEADFVISADNLIKIGDYFQPEPGYVFFVMTKEQDPLQIKLHGIGIKII